MSEKLLSHEEIDCLLSNVKLDSFDNDEYTELMRQQDELDSNMSEADRIKLIKDIFEKRK